MYDDSGEIKKLTNAATSSTFPARLAGINLSASSTGASSVISVSINPGATQFTVISRLANSKASDFDANVWMQRK